MISNAMAALFHPLMKPGQMLFIEINAVIILYYAVCLKTTLIFHAHAIFRNHPFNVPIVITNIEGNVIQTSGINFPASVWIHPFARHVIVIKIISRRKRSCRIGKAGLCADTEGMVVVYSQKIHCILTDDLQIL